MMLRAIKRGWKRGKCMLWLRRTEKEYEKLIGTFGNEKWKKVCRQVHVPMDALTLKGSTVWMTRKNGEKLPVIMYGALSEYMALRDTDDPRVELIYLDEAFATVERTRAYRGNEVANAMDILKSMRRDNLPVRMVIAGNREAVCAPWYDYFGVKRPSIDEGFCYLTTKDGERVAFERIRKKDPDKSFMNLVSGTGYGAFMKGEAKGVNPELLMPVRAGAVFYCNVDFGQKLSIWRKDGYFIFANIEYKSHVVTDRLDYAGRAVMFTPDIKKHFVLLRKAFKCGMVRFANRESYAGGIEALRKLV